MATTVAEAIYRARTEGKEQVDALARSVDGLSISEEKVTRATTASEAGFARLQARLDPVVRAQQQYERTLEQVSRYEAAGVGSVQQRTAIIDIATRKYMDQVAALQRAAQAQDQYNLAAQNGNSAAAINNRLGVTDNFNTAARAQDVAAYGDELDRLRAKYNPLFAASKQYESELDGINQAAKLGAISSVEQAAAIETLNSRYKLAQTGANDLSGAHRNMSTQAMAAQHSIRSMIEQFALGIPPTQILFGQMNHLSYAATGPGGLSGAFKEVGGLLKGLGASALEFITPVVAGFAAVAASIGAAVVALIHYSNEQRQVRQSLFGTGTASGASVLDINTIASQGASPSGLSVSEARALASALAATGKIGVDSIGPIVKLGHDIATVYGEDATAAAKRLAQAFSDPAKGADDLNKRLGFLDAATQRYLQNLVAQGRISDAQNVLYQKTAQSLQGVQDHVATSTKIWTTLGNAISNVWDKFGEFASRATGIGFIEGTQEQITRLTKEVETFKSAIANTPPAGQSDLIAHLTQVQAELDAATAKWQRYRQSIEDAQARRDSFAQAAAVRKMLPEIDQLDGVNNDYLRLSLTLEAVNRTGGEHSRILEAMGVSYGQLAKAVEEARGKVEGFKSENDKAAASLELQIKAVGARSPTQRGEIAYQQTLLNRGSTSPNAQREAELARTLAVRQAEFDISQAAQQRLLTSQQSTESAKLELDIVGKSSVEQERQRSLLQAKQQLEQDALRTYGSRDAYDKSHLKALEDEINKQAQIKQTLAEQQALRDVQFDRSQIGRSSDEQAIASKLRSIYGDDYEAQMNGNIAAQMRFNQSLQFTHDLGLEVFQGLTDRSKSFGDVMSDAFKKVTARLTEFAFNQAWNALFSNLGKSQSYNYGGVNVPVIGGGSGLFGGAIIPGILHDGGLGRDAPSSGLLIHPAYFENAPRFHTGKLPWGPDEMPAIIRPEEEVLTANDPRHRWNIGASGSRVAAPPAGGEITVRVTTDVDKDGNIRAFVQDVSGQVAGQAIKAAQPQIVQAASNKTMRDLPKARRANPNLYAPG